MDNNQQQRYKRNIQLPEIGIEGQQKIAAARVLIIGIGGLGSPVALYLAAAGVGTLGLMDFDNVDITNLQRQIIHYTPDIDTPKVDSAKKKLRQLNPDIRLVTYQQLFNADNAQQIVNEYDILVDATDNSTAKFFINDIAVKYRKPLVHGAINQFSGVVMTILPNHANYRDLFPEEPTSTPPSSDYGILGAIAGTIGTIQATEVLKLITNSGAPLTDTLLIYDALKMEFQKIIV